MRKIIFIFSLFLFLPLAASAHQPVLVGTNMDVTVSQPEISKAYYGELKTRKAPSYVIESNKSFDLYVGLLVPDMQGINKDIEVEILKVGEHRDVLKVLSGKSAEWKNFFEPYAGDNYLQGPEYRARVQPGLYNISIYTDTPPAKYVLAIGEKEAFGPAAILKAALVLPKLKTQFFDQPWYMAYWNRSGLYLGFALFGVILVLAGGGLIIKKIKR